MQLTFSYIDLLVIGLLAFTTWYGAKRGLLISAYNFAAYFLTYILTTIFYKPFAKYLSTTELFNKINLTIYDKIDYSDKINAEAYSSTADYLKDIGFPDFIVDWIANNVNVDIYQTFGMDSYRELISQSLTEFFITILSFITVFILVIILLRIGGMILQIVKHLPVINQLDSAGGAVFGLLNGVIIVTLAFLVISAIFIYSMSPDNVIAFDKSFFYNIFTNINIFEQFNVLS